MRIEVVNTAARPVVRAGVKQVFILRPSILGNPFVVWREGSRQAAVEKYRRYLWSILQAGVKSGQWPGPPAALTSEVKDALRRGEYGGLDVELQVWVGVVDVLRQARQVPRLELVCCCAPLVCHGDVLKRALEWLDGQAPRLI